MSLTFGSGEGVAGSLIAIDVSTDEAFRGIECNIFYNFANFSFQGFSVLAGGPIYDTNEPEPGRIRFVVGTSELSLPVDTPWGQLEFSVRSGATLGVHQLTTTDVVTDASGLIINDGSLTITEETSDMSTIAWDYADANITRFSVVGYELEENIDGAGWMQIANPAQDVKQFDHDIPDNSGIHSFRVRALWRGGSDQTPYSEVLAVDTDDAPAPSNLRII